ncbi:hypothetical protein KASHIRA_01610 [Serratia phage vB_SmaM-Kashira]|nr:hypothetical protein [Acinetobacter phage ABPH49]URC22735.1 hypothetical protein KASHIRA_01610 [Serratia phage vB_SmaM-Kashira]
MKLRAYALVNQYIAGIHAGIQTAHALMELSAKYDLRDCFDGDDAAMFYDWRREDKTLIVLNGGYQQRIYEAMELWSKSVFPYAHFCEEQDALNGALTAAVIILPEYVYDRANHITSEDGSSLYHMPDGLETGNDVVELNYIERQISESLGKFRLKGE